MCGIAGIINSRLDRDELEMRLQKLQRALHHRGPDDHGLFVSKDNVAGLVSTRLAILDLSDAGHQPMQSPDGRYTIVFNGEIYNYDVLRKQLLAGGCSLRSHSDTEVMLELFCQEGPECLDKLEGMFAFAIWDEEQGKLFLARDPLGIKPLYLTNTPDRICFASEMRALLLTGMTERKISDAGLFGYLLSGSVPEPETIVEGVRLLPAGHYLIWSEKECSLQSYWEVNFPDEKDEPRSMMVTSREEATRIVRGALVESIGRHLVSDVPVGVFLSGGIDSTAVVALASQQTTEPLRTFSISFDDPGFNEGDVAARTAAHFGTKHTDWRIDAATAKESFKDFLDRSDQPTIDGFNTFCVAKMAHDHGLKVVLSGLGGDEIFGGYPSFQRMPALTKLGCALRGPWRSIVIFALEHVPSLRAHRIAYLLRTSTEPEYVYECVRGIFTAPEASSLLAFYGITNRADERALPEAPPFLPTEEDEVSYLELTRYMRNQLLRDSDVMSMAWSLELRVPFVDRKLIDAVSIIPARWRLARGKQILLDAVPEIPEWVRNRPKQGFTFPFEDWVTSEWRDIFQRIEARSPVRLKNWYRTWCLFALENFLERNGMEIGETLRS
ncbi:MAG TPA: asparagine synthase (glutamine-hydrolyzing) [Chthoniobacterales bacterium]